MNSSTGGTTKDGGKWGVVKGAAIVLGGAKTTAHNCYGVGTKECANDDLLRNGEPMNWEPVSVQKITIKEQTMSKWILYILMTALMTGCSMNYFQPPPEAWEYFYKHKRGDTPFEVIKQDMLACGFDSPYSSYIEANDEHDTQYINAVLCMERKGYRNSSLKKGVCESYKEKPACQKYLAQ